MFFVSNERVYWMYSLVLWICSVYFFFIFLNYFVCSVSEWIFLNGSSVWKQLQLDVKFSSAYLPILSKWFNLSVLVGGCVAFFPIHRFVLRCFYGFAASIGQKYAHSKQLRKFSNLFTICLLSTRSNIHRSHFFSRITHSYCVYLFIFICHEMITKFNRSKYRKLKS